MGNRQAQPACKFFWIETSRPELNSLWMKPRQSLSFSILGGKLRSLVLFPSDCGGGRSFKHSRSFLEIKSCMRLTFYKARA